MKREKQYDMFDVATGACTLDDYLFQRYSENDLASTFWIDEKDEVDELRAPKPTADGQPGTEPEVIPIQGPRAPQNPGLSKPPPPPEGLQPDSPPGPSVSDFPRSSDPGPPSPDGRDTLQESGPPPVAPGMESYQNRSPVAPPAHSGDSFQASNENETEQQSEAGETVQTGPTPPSMADLLARFHQATKEYQERSLQVEPGESEDKPEESEAEPPQEP